MNQKTQNNETSRARLFEIADLLATGLIRCRQSANNAHLPAVDLDNTCEPRVYVDALKPHRRDHRESH